MLLAGADGLVNQHTLDTLTVLGLRQPLPRFNTIDHGDVIEACR